MKRLLRPALEIPRLEMPRLGLPAFRLRILVREHDGFRVAEEDFRLRGPGEILGTAQHGLPRFRVADLIRDVRLLDQARRDAERILKKDPTLTAPDHALLVKSAERIKHLTA